MVCKTRIIIISTQTSIARQPKFTTTTAAKSASSGFPRLSACPHGVSVHIVEKHPRSVLIKQKNPNTGFSYREYEAPSPKKLRKLKKKL